MGLFNRFKGAFKGFAHPEKWGSSIFYSVNGTSDTSQDLIKDFKEIPELNAVINWKARAFSNMDLRVVSKTTGEIVENELSKLLENPNWFQAQGEFLRQTKIFHDLFGNEYLYFLKPVGMNKVSGIYTLPDNIMTIDVGNTPFFLTTEEEVKYTANWNNKEYTLESDNVIHLNDNRVELTAKDYLKGTSKAEALKEPLRNIRAAYNVRGTNLRNMGPLGIISSAARDGMGSLPLQPDDKDEIKKDLQRNYGALSNQFKYILSSKSVDFTQLSTDLDKLKPFDEVLKDFDKILDAYGLTKDIFSSAENSTFTNKREAEKQAYQNSIIPESVEWLDAFNKQLNTEAESWIVVGDYFHLPVFQEDENERATTLQTITNTLSTQLADGVISIEEYKEEINKFYE